MDPRLSTCRNRMSDRRGLRRGMKIRGEGMMFRNEADESAERIESM